MRRVFEESVRPVWSHIIGGRLGLGELGKTLPVTCKFTGQSVTSVALASEAETLAAIRKGVEAEEAMRSLKSYERKRILQDIVKEIQKRETEMVHTIVYEVGKSVRDATVEVARTIETFTIAAEESVRRVGEFAPMDISARNAPYSMITQNFPIGLVSMISPFNFPMNLVAHKIAPAIAAGCPFVLKPSERTPLGAFLIGEIVSQVPGLPEGAFSVLLPQDTATAQHLVTDPEIKCFSFTGSPGVGWHLKQLAGRKRVLLELGGNAACVVDDTADLQLAAQRILIGAYSNAGQSCISVQRVFAHRNIYEPLRQLLRQGAQTLSTQRGDPFEESTFLSPMISPHEAERVESWIGQATAQGATVLTGGTRSGSFFDCTIIENAGPRSVVNDKEIFGPVFTLQPFDDFKDVCRSINDSEFGLQAGIFTSNINRAFYAYNNLHVGGVVINDIPSVRVDSQPYGGIKASGLGREGIRDSIQEYSEKKVLLLRDLGI